MPVLTYQPPPPNRYAGTIGEMMLAAAQAQGQGLVAAGQARAQTAGVLGATVGELLKTPQRIEQEKQFRERQAIEMQAARLGLANQQGQLYERGQKFADAQELDTIKSSALVSTSDGQVRYDPARLGQGLQQAKSARIKANATEILDSAQKGNASLDELKNIQEASDADIRGFYAEAQAKAGGMPGDQQMTRTIFLANHPGKESVINQVDDALSRYPNQRDQVLAKYRDGSPALKKASTTKPGTTDYERYLNRVEQSAGHQLTPAEELQERAKFEGASKPPPKPPEPGTFEDYLGSYARDVVKRPLATLTAADKEAARQRWMQSGKDPELTALAKSSAELRVLLERAQLGQQPTADDAKTIAQQLVAHKISPSQLSLFGGFGTAGAAFKRMVGLEATKLDPSFNWEEAESTYDLAKSPTFQQTIRYMDSVQESMPRLQQTANQLGNSKVRFVNGIKNLTKNQLNDPTLKAFQTDVLLVGDEVAKILQGGGTGSATSDAKLKQANTLLNTTDSPQSIAAALKEINALIGFRKTALTRGTYLEQKSSGGGDPSDPLGLGLGKKK